MKLQKYQGNLESLLVQRQYLLLGCGTLLFSNVLLSTVAFFHDEKVVVVPPQTNSRFWASKHAVSPSYVEEMALFFTNLLLEMSPESAVYKRDLILRHVTANGYGALKAKLLADERRIQKERVVTSFQPHLIKISGMKAAVTGDLARYVGEKRISQSRDTYGLTFVYRHGRLLLKAFELEKSDG